MAVLPGPAIAQQTAEADRFVDSAGVNIHLHYNDTPYWDQFPLIRSRLVELGVRHVRDGLIDTEWREYYYRFHSLAQAGIRGTFITAPEQSTELWASYPARMGSAFEAYEAPNEYRKSSGDPNWVQTLTETMARLGSLSNDPRAAPFPVFGPSLESAAAYASLGDVSAHFDAANLHNYFGGRHPETPGWGDDGFGSIAWNLRMIEPYAGGKPVVTTETGYQDGSVTVDAIPQDIAGRYMPRVLLEQFRAGIARTYLYELIDWPNSGNYGLLNQDGSPKPAFRAVKGLLNLLSDPGPAFTPEDLEYSVQGGDDVHHMAFQKRDGTYLLALWLGVPSYHVESRQHIPVAPQYITVTTAAPLSLVRTHRWQGDGSLSTSTAALTTTSFPVRVYDTLTVIELVTPAPPGSVPGIPGLLSAIINYLSVLLRWQPSDEGGAPTGYTVEVATLADFSNTVAMPVGPVTELTVPAVVPGNYFVRVRASNEHGRSEASPVSSFAVGAPAAPQLAAIETSRNPVTLSWTPSMGAQQYVLSAGTTPGASDIAVVPMGMARHVTAPVPPGVRFYVRVAALNAYGAARSNEVSFMVPGPQAPGPPVLHAAQVDGRLVTLTWTPGPGGTPDDYVLLIGNTPGTGNLGILPVGPATTVTGVSPFAGPLFVRVFARNALGVAGSNEVGFTVP